MTTQKRIAVVGLDALPYHSLKKLAESGVAPHLFNNKTLMDAKKLIAIPPVTQASWPSIMSGVNPGKHGLFFFVHIAANDLFNFHYTNLRDLMHPRIHEMLSMNRITSFILNPIPDYPILPMKYIRVISNMFFTPYPISFPNRLNEKYYSGIELPVKQNEENVVQYLERTITLVEDLIKDPPHLIWINLSFPDLLFHVDDEFVRDPSKYKDIWQRINNMVKILKDNYDDVIVVSDHGFSLFNKQFLINDILVELKLAYPKARNEPIPQFVQIKTEKELSEPHTSHMKVPYIIVKVLEITNTIGIARIVYQKIIRNIYRKITGKNLILHGGLYPSFIKSIAVYPQAYMFGIFVKKQEYVDYIVNELRKYDALYLVDKASNVYKGPYVDRGPHIVVIPNYSKGYILDNIGIYGERVRKVNVGSHDLWGVLFHLNESSDVFDWSLLPEEVPNHLVAGVVMCMMGQPLSVEQDDKELVERACRYPVSYKNYKTRFLLAKKLYFGKRSRGS